MHNFRALVASALIVTVVVISAGTTSVAASIPRAAAEPVTPGPSWTWPLGEPRVIIQPFVAPASPYAAGHRGLDLAAVPNAAVFAVSDGVVSFSGTVVDRPVLSILHPGDVISTLEPVIALVHAGEPVRAGQKIGTVDSGGHCPPGCLHFGVRSHGLYVSPLLFVGIVPRAVLLPNLP